MTVLELGQSLALDRAAMRKPLGRLQRQGLIRQVGISDSQREWGVGAPMPVWEVVAPTALP
jgi:hypothetical protein